MKKIIFHLLLLSCIPIYAQNTLSGRVIDELSLPMAFANVVLINRADSAFVTGAVTKEDGVFTIETDQQDGLLKVSSIGYITRYIDAQQNSIRDIQMVPDSQALREVVVKGFRPQYQMNGHALTVNVQGTMLSEAGTADDVIGLLPGVDSGNGSFKVIGKGTPLIYVNGRLLRNTAELVRLSSKDIASIELDTNPGAKYPASVSSVILIKTIKKAGDGLGGSARLVAKQAHYGSTNEMFDLNYRRNGLDLFGELYHDFEHFYQKQRGDTRSRTSTDQWRELQTFMGDHKKNQVSATLGINYQINSNHSVGVKYDTGNGALGECANWPKEEFVYKNGVQIEQMSYQGELRRSQPFSHMLNTYYNGKVGKWSIDYNADYYFSAKRTFQDMTETSLNDAQRFVNTRSKQRSELWASKLVLGHPLFAGMLEGGYEYTHIDHTDVYSSLQQITPSTDDHVKEQMLAGFLSYAWSIRDIKLEAGLRYEHVLSDCYTFGAFMPEQSRTYDRLFPNASLTFPMGMANVSLSYTEKTERPSYNKLCSFVQYDSRYLYETGNPLLRPAIFRNLDLLGTYKWVYVSLSYKWIKDHLSSVIMPYAEDSPINIERSVNLDHFSAFIGIIQLSPKIGRWSPTWRLFVYRQNYEQQTANGIRSFKSPQFQPRWSNFINLGKRFILFASVNGRMAGDYDNMYIKPSWQANLGISRQMGGWNLQLRAYDLFRTARQSMIIYGYSATYDKWNYSDSQYIQLTATYRFNSTRSKYKGTGAGNAEKNRL